MSGGRGTAARRAPAGSSRFVSGRGGRVHWCRELWARNRYLGEDSLAISHSEVELALATRDELLDAELEFWATDEQAHRLSAELDELARADDPRWERLRSELALEPAEQELLALALAAELVPSLRRVYGYLLDETAPLDPTPALVADLWGRLAPPRLRNDSALVRWALARPTGSGRDPGFELDGLGRRSARTRPPVRRGPVWLRTAR